MSDASHDAIQRTRDSLGRCVDCKTFLQRFYEIFIGASPDIAELFRETDLERQKAVLRDSLYVMLVAAGTEKGPAHDEVERLSARHVELGVTAEMYDVWIDSLIQAAREHDTHFTDALERDWRTSFGGPMELMKSAG